MPYWSELNHEFLVEIAWRIKLCEDFVSFRWVCKSWQSAATLENFRYKNMQIPWLMLAPDPEKGRNNVLEFYNLPKDMSFQITLQEVSVRKCLSSRGWLLTISRRWRMSLLHPFSRVEINLPQIKTFIDKCVLSANPSSTSDYRVMVIFGARGNLAYWKPGDEAWSMIDTKPGDEVWSIIDEWYGRISDVIFHQEHDQFYSINYRGQIMAYGGDNPTAAQVVVEMPNGLIKDFDEKLYLVESSGALLAVRKGGVQSQPVNEVRKRTYGVTGFQVFKVDLNNNTWIEVENLGNRALFLGQNSSMSIEASKATHCKPNCIYFTDDCSESFCYRFWNRIGSGKEDLGIYNMEDKSFVPHFKENSLYHRNFPPIWVEQTLI